MKVYAVVPCLNEGLRIKSVIENLKPFVAKVVVVDDGSVDNTSSQAGEAGAIVLRHQINRGYGAALTTGFAWCLDNGAEIILMFDGDGQFDAAEIPKLISPLTEGRADIVLGSRFLDKQSVDSTPWTKKYLILYPARILEKLVTGLPLSDVHNGFRAMMAGTVRKLTFQHDGMAWQTELDKQIKSLKLRYLEVPVKVRYYKYGQGFAGGVLIIKDLLLSKFTR